MSYILDALKKAAEQRDVHTPAMRRLFAPVPEVADAPRWRVALVGGGAAVAGAAAVAVVWALWPATPVVVTDKVDAAPPAARVQPETPPAVQPPPPPARPIVRTTPAPAKAVSPDGRPARTPPRSAETRRPRADETPSVVEPAVAPPPVIAALRPAPAPVQAPAPVPIPARTAPAPVAPAPAVRAPAGAPPAGGATPRAESGSAMKLEVIVYSDERARRLAFINGRKYVEGDTLLDGAKIQEIQPNAVVIVEDGRRVLLRP